MLRDMLNLTAVQVAREADTADGKGAVSQSTTLTTLGAAQIWQNSGSSGVLSDKISKMSSHVLACEPGGYAWNEYDRYVVYGSIRYKVVGRADNVSQMDEVEVVGLELIT